MIASKIINWLSWMSGTAVEGLLFFYINVATWSQYLSGKNLTNITCCSSFFRFLNYVNLSSPVRLLATCLFYWQMRDMRDNEMDFLLCMLFKMHSLSRYHTPFFYDGTNSNSITFHLCIELVRKGNQTFKAISFYIG